jgi:hypothetical protein
MERWARGLDPRFVKFLRVFRRTMVDYMEREAREVVMPSKSKSQARLMRAAAHDPGARPRASSGLAKRAGVPVAVAKEYVAADTRSPALGSDRGGLSVGKGGGKRK